MDELLLFTLTSPSLHFRWMGSFLQIILTSPSPQIKQTGSCLLFTLTSPSLHFRWTGSFLQFLLTSSSLNSDGRAPTIYIDEPFTALQMDGLLPTIPIDELFPQLRWTSSYYSHRQALHCISDRRAPAYKSY